MLPVFNERPSLESLYRDLTRSLQPLDLSYEILFVDDGSGDGSTEILRRLASEDARVRVLEFVRNFGQTAALAAGFEHARGQIIVPLNADLQNDPEDIPAVLEKLQEGFEVVSCWRRIAATPGLRAFSPPGWPIGSLAGSVACIFTITGAH